MKSATENGRPEQSADRGPLPDASPRPPDRSGQLLALAWAKARMVRHGLAAVRHESKLKIGIVALSAVLLFWGIFALAHWGFGLSEDLGAELLGLGQVTLSDLILKRLLSLFSLALLVLLTLSNVLAAFAFFYRSREVAFLVATPITPSAFFLSRFSECVTFTSWALGYLGSPVLLAYGLATQAPPLYYLALVLFFGPFVLIPAALGTFLAIVLVRILAGRRRGAVVGLAALLLVMLFGFFRQELAVPDFARNPDFRLLLDGLGASQSPWLPSTWLSAGIVSAATGMTREAGFNWLLLLANALFAVWLTQGAAGRWFYPGWSALQGDGAQPGATAGGRMLGQRGLLGWLEAGLNRWLPPKSSRPLRALIAKDLRNFWRDPAQWSQFLLLFGIMAVYVANLDSTRSGTAPELWRAWGTLLNLAASALILASLTSRFIFPLISLEGRRFWILGLAPLPRAALVWQKFWLSCGTTALFTISLTALSAYRLELDGIAWALSLVGVIATTFALSGLAVGLGSLYPTFTDDNPARIVSGLGGTLNFLFSLLYVALMLAAQAVVLLWPQLVGVLGAEAYHWVVAAAFAWIVGLTAVTCALPLKLGIRHLEQLEF